ncbi:MAG TPA: precorrin-2 C(20)-methyltransferase [Hyphomicrobium sp.]|jgi:precorrin-2/cobalt-factor-2 C20-methyltransferase|nr:precorrin-2 C(20)-methyltransferase [Hyphomicrobium sp.]
MSALDILAGSAVAGTLYGIGVGPGDARLLTLRAAGLVTSVDVLAFFAKRGREGNARRIASQLVGNGRTELRLEYPVTDEIPVSDPDYTAQIAEFYEASARAIADHLGNGRSVGLLAEGDPFFYGSFMHMWRRLDGRYPIEVVPGVTGMSGCWTSANTPITWGDDILTVLPGTLDEGVLAERLAASNAAVIMKVGKNLAKVRRAVEAAGLMSRAIYVERGTMPDERVLPLAKCTDESGPYFAMVIVPGEGRKI